MSKHYKQVFSIFSLLGIFLGICVMNIPQSVSAQQIPDTPTPTKPDISRNQLGHTALVNQAITDNYGYQLDTYPSSFIGAVGGTVINFSDRDDALSDPIPIGFAFPFYEGTYTQLFVSTDGVIHFGESYHSYENRDIPRDTLPDNIIAAFWDDLNLSVDGTVLYKNGSDSEGQFLIIEWNEVTRVGTPGDVLTFEAILRDNGDIIIQYEMLAGTIDEATVGIEDDKGVDGISYVYNSTGLSTGTALHFTRPNNSAHAKIYPLYRGGFTYSGKTDFWFTIRNNGTSGSDTYNLQLSAYDASWDVSLYDESGRKLSDTDGNGKIDTGALNHLQEIRVKGQVISPETAQIGDEIQVDLTVISSKDTSKTALASVTVAIPTPFAQAILSDGDMRLHLIWRENQFSALAAPTQFTGSFLTVQRLPNGNYLYSWEQNGNSGNGEFITDLRYTILSDIGGALLDVKQLTNNNAVTQTTEDRNLVTSVTNNGLVGAAWWRRETNLPAGGEPEYRYNIFFSVIDQNGNTVIPETNVTQNSNWGYPYFLYPQITATSDNRFVIAWTRDDLVGKDSINDIEYAIYSTTPNTPPVKPPTILTSSNPGVVNYKKPSLAGMDQNKALLTYMVSEPQGSDTLAYMVLDSSGNVIKTQTAIPGSNGADFQDSDQLGSGHVLLAWPSTTTGQVGFCLFDVTSGEVTPSGTQYLTPPNFRDPDSVSVARDEAGRGVITWRDRSQVEYLYYALIDPSGSVLTPATTFLSSVETGKTLTTNGYGFGLASYEGSWLVLLPFTHR